MPHEVFVQRHIVLNSRDTPIRVENYRNVVHRDVRYHPDEIVLTPAGIRSGWHWHARSRVIVITLDPERLRRFASSELGLVLTDRQLQDTAQAADADLCQTGAMLLQVLREQGAGSQVINESLAHIFLEYPS